MHVTGKAQPAGTGREGRFSEWWSGHRELAGALAGICFYCLEYGKSKAQTEAEVRDYLTENDWFGELPCSVDEFASAWLYG